MANFDDKLLVVPCVEVKNSSFDGYYHVAFRLSGDDSGNDWSVKESKISNAESCGLANTAAVNIDDLLNTLGLSLNSNSGTSARAGDNKKTIADLSRNLLVLPCVEVKNTTFNGYYHVLFQASGNKTGSNWSLKSANKVTAATCEYNDNEDIKTDQLLQTNGLSSVNVLK